MHDLRTGIYLLILLSTIIGCVLISAFASLVDCAFGIASFTGGLKICVITAGIKKYKSIFKEKKTKLDKIVLLAKTKLNTIDVLNLKTLIDSHSSYFEFALVNNALKEENNMKEAIKNSNIFKSDNI